MVRMGVEVEAIKVCLRNVNPFEVTNAFKDVWQSLAS